MAMGNRDRWITACGAGGGPQSAVENLWVAKERRARRRLLTKMHRNIIGS
jgi:hypothetical protein